MLIMYHTEISVVTWKYLILIEFFHHIQIPEVQDEMMQKQFKIPNLIHFIWFGCHPLRIDHYMAYVILFAYTPGFVL